MPSLMECVLNDLKTDPEPESDEDMLASFDLDAFAIAEEPGGWEPATPNGPGYYDYDGLNEDDFLQTGPPVYERNGYIIVRGEHFHQTMWFVY